MLGPVKQCVERFLEANPSYSARTDRVVYFDVTNRKIDGSCFLFFAGEEESPTLVAKAARTAAGKAVFEIEYDNLQQLQAMGMNREGPATPEPLGRWVEGETLITLQSALRGTLMKNVPGNRLFAADRIEASLDRVLDWWDRLQDCSVPQRLPFNEQAYDAQVLSEVRRFRRRYRLKADEEEFLDRHFLGDRPLAGVELPLMARHGDFCAANMVMQDRGIGVIDWEFPLSHRTPLFDLFFFFSSVRFPFSGVGGEAAHSDSFVEVFWGESYFTAAMHDRLQGCCRVFDIAPETLPGLFTLSLIQTANMKYDGLIVSHEMKESEIETIADEEKAAVWASFRDPDKDAPFARIRNGVYENLRQVVRRGCHDSDERVIYACEHHDAVLSHWRQRNLREIRLAHVDFHDDLRGLFVDRRRKLAYPIGGGARELDAGNFLAHAVLERRLRSIRWIHGRIGGRAWDAGIVRFESDLSAWRHRRRRRHGPGDEVALEFEELLVEDWNGLEPGELLSVDWDCFASILLDAEGIDERVASFLSRLDGERPADTYVAYSPEYCRPTLERFSGFVGELAARFEQPVEWLSPGLRQGRLHPSGVDAGLPRDPWMRLVLFLRRRGIY